MNAKMFAMLSVCAVACSASAVTVTDVSACQRYPWNSLIDIDFTIGDASADAQFKIDVKASYLGDTRILDARTFVTEPVVKPGTRRITWDIGKDCQDFKADDLRVAVTASPFTNGTDGVYMVIDLSGGSNASSYPVRYTTTPPKHSVNAEDPCKTTEMWLKRIKCGSFMFCKGFESTGYFRVNLTKDFYLSIFECTQQQWAQITGDWPSRFTNEQCRSTRPCESISLSSVFGHYYWPMDKEPKSSYPVATMRARTGLSTFSLPTESQWEYANRCGSNGGLHSSYSYSQIRYNLSYESAEAAGFSCGLENGPACVGTYAPNAWGIYDMFGNVAESCLDAGVDSTKLQKYYGLLSGLALEDCTAANVVVSDPDGGPVKGMYEEDSPYKGYESSYQYYHVIRGAGWSNTSGHMNHFQRTTNPDNFKGPTKGVRFVVTCE